jgi:hypothetical protein
LKMESWKQYTTLVGRVYKPDNKNISCSQ